MANGSLRPPSVVLFLAVAGNTITQYVSENDRTASLSFITRPYTYRL